MKIKTKLVIAFIVILLAPTALTVLCGLVITQSRIDTTKEYYGIEVLHYEELANSTQMFNKLTQKLYSEILSGIEAHPEKFWDVGYLEGLNERLLDKYSFLMVRKNEEILYNGGGEKLSEILDRLPSYGGYRQGKENSLYLSGENKYLVKQIDLAEQDGDRLSMFIVTEVEELMPEVRILIRDMVLVILTILGLTALLLVTWIHQSLVKPLKQLRVATENIAEGNLDFVLETDMKNEIGELCSDFEEMRKRLKESAEEKVQYDKESKELVSNISHDLKTPITAIKGYVEGIMDGVADTPEKMEKYIRTIYSKANDMERLIEELTFYSKIDTNKIPYNFKKIDIDQYFRDCVEELSLELDAQNIDVTYFNYTKGQVIIIADPEQLKKVVNNIVGNSVKYIGNKKGVINIRIQDAEDFVQIEIEDNGKGISVRDLPYVFDRFYRTDASRNSSQGGSGIGLSIVRKIIEDHGGRIWAASKENTGTVMNFVFRKYQEEGRHE